jgi:hypothetical protein
MLCMVYSSDKEPGISIRNQPILPGKLKREAILVFPMGYQVVRNWTMENCFVFLPISTTVLRWNGSIHDVGDLQRLRGEIAAEVIPSLRAMAAASLV